MRHNRLGGTIEVETGAEGLRAFVIVRSDGEPVPDEEVPRPVQPFHRLHGDVAGLGLAIASAVAARPGGGLDVTLCSPAFIAR